jgi:hypothetical protein
MQFNIYDFFIRNVPINMLQPAFRPSSGWSAFVRYLYILDLINARNMEYFKIINALQAKLRTPTRMKKKNYFKLS